MTIKTVALIGASGHLGSAILHALVSAGQFEVTVVRRQSSTYTPPPSLSSNPQVIAKTVDDDLSLESLKTALAGQDAVVVSMRFSQPSHHHRIAEAALAVCARRIIPADYGSCDSASRRAQELVPLYKHKAGVRRKLQELVASAKPSGSPFSWTGFVCGHFFDWGLREGFLHFDLKTGAADILDGGKYRSSTATLARVAEAVVLVLERDEDERLKNKVLYIQSFCVSQLDVLASLERATGEKWNVRYLESGSFIEEHRIKADAGDKEAVEDLVFALGALDGNWEEREGFAMDLLGLENESLDDTVKRVVESQA